MNSVTAYITNFLHKCSPFNLLSIEELAEITAHVRVINLEKKRKLFSINDPLHEYFYVVSSGLINLTIFSNAEETILDKCQEGSIFGLRPFFAKNNYMVTATAREESTLYAIPIDVFRPYVAKNQDILNLLLEKFSVDKRNVVGKESYEINLISENAFFAGQDSEMQIFQNLSYNTNPILVTTLAIAKDVAILMKNAKEDNAIVCEDKIPVGLVTESNLVHKIVTGDFPNTTSIDTLMNYPVVTVTDNITVEEAQLLMLKNNVTHLCVTIDGSDKTEVKGVITEHDLILAQANNPGVLIKEIKKTQSVEELKEIRSKLNDIIRSSIQKNIPIMHISNVASQVNFAILKRAVEQSILELGPPPARFTWMALGSQARKEQLLFTDQNSILIFEDVKTNNHRDIKDYFLKLAKKTTDSLEKIGYKKCPNGHIASNMLWCKSLTDWTKQYEAWINKPGENNNKLSSIFFDFEIVFGDQKIEDNLNEVLLKNLVNKVSFFDFLGNEALRNNLALTFFKKIIVEEDGLNRNKFDIKTRGILPLVDGARLLTLSYRLQGIHNTYIRFKQLAISDPKNAEIYLDCAEAFLTLTRFKTLEGIKNSDSGQYINLEELSKIDREKLRLALFPMKELEELIKSKFQLTQFS